MNGYAGKINGDLSDFPVLIQNIYIAAEHRQAGKIVSLDIRCFAHQIQAGKNIINASAGAGDVSIEFLK